MDKVLSKLVLVCALVFILSGCGGGSDGQIVQGNSIIDCIDPNAITNGATKFESTTKWVCNATDSNNQIIKETYLIFADGTGEVSLDGVTVFSVFTWTHTNCNNFKFIDIQGEATVKVLGGSTASGIFTFESSRVGNVACQLMNL